MNLAPYVLAVTSLKSFISTLLPFIQDGTGAIVRTIYAKLKEKRSVLDYGAIGDGIAEDEVIDAAVGSLPSMRGAA